MSARPRARILALLETRGELTTLAVCDALGLAERTARQALVTLVAEGRVTFTYTGGQGNERRWGLLFSGTSD